MQNPTGKSGNVRYYTGNSAQIQIVLKQTTDNIKCKMAQVISLLRCVVSVRWAEPQEVSSLLFNSFHSSAGFAVHVGQLT